MWHNALISTITERGKASNDKMSTGTIVLDIVMLFLLGNVGRYSDTNAC